MGFPCPEFLFPPLTIENRIREILSVFRVHLMSDMHCRYSIAFDGR